jgi:hypothetical protein
MEFLVKCETERKRQVAVGNGVGYGEVIPPSACLHSRQSDSWDDLLDLVGVDRVCLVIRCDMVYGLGLGVCGLERIIPNFSWFYEGRHL